MATDTSIEWADKTWSPIIGCDRVSPGCDSCYAISTARIREGNPHPRIAAAFAGTTQRTEAGVDWSGRINLLADRLTEPLRWKTSRKVFVNSLSDLFHKNVPDDFIAKVFAIMALTPQHSYQLLTKRHARMRSVLNDHCTCGNGHVPGVHFRSAMAWAVSKANPERIPGVPDDAEQRVYNAPWPLPNLHLGVSVENQHWANIRIPALLDTPAAVRWISAEPLLGPIRLSASWIPIPADYRPVELADILGIGQPERLNWVVAGGESGPKARPAHPDWFRSLRDECAAADVPFLFKQHGNWISRDDLDADARASAWNEKRVLYVHPADGRTQTHGQWGINDHLEGWACVQRVGKKNAGRVLDGRTHDAFPTVP
jgi:protein gp37